MNTMAEAFGTIISKVLYHLWGTAHQNSSNSPTDYGYTGQMQVGDIYYYNARWYDPMIGRFMQADTIVPSHQGTQGFDRYAYVNNNPVNGTDPTVHCFVDPRDPYVDYECHSLALQISKAESQGSPHLTDILYEEFDMYSYESLQEYYNVGVAPYLKVQQFTAKMAESVAMSQTDDVDALVSILEYSYAIAGDNLEFGLIYASSAFYRLEIGLLGGGKDYQYTYITNASFGISGFHDNYTGVSTNTNQLEHFIGEAAIFSHLGLNQRLGNLGAWFQDRGNSAGSIADRRLGQLASWWVNQGFFKVGISGLGDILRRGELQYAQ